MSTQNATQADRVARAKFVHLLSLNSENQERDDINDILMKSLVLGQFICGILFFLVLFGVSSTTILTLECIVVAFCILSFSFGISADKALSTMALDRTHRDACKELNIDVSGALIRTADEQWADLEVAW